MFQSTRRNAMSRRGFTMIELLVVIVVLAVLSAIVMPRFMDAAQRSRETALRGDLKLMRNAIEAFRSDTGLYPLTIADLTVDAAPAHGNDGAGEEDLIATTFHGPYLQTEAVDPVSSTAFTYTATTGVVVSSATGDGLDGTAFSTW